MRKVALSLSFLALASCATWGKPAKPETTAFVLGTIHGNMLDQPKNGVKDFVSALHQYKPTVILAEVRPDMYGPLEGTIDGGAEQALVYAYAETAGATVVPVDWFNDDYVKQAEEETAAMTPALKAEIDPLFASFRKVVETSTLAESQNAETQNLIRARYELLAKNGLKAEEKRNKVICENIKVKLPELEGQRVLVVFGLAHKFALDDCLAAAGQPPVKLEKWYDASVTPPFSPAFKSKAVEIFKSAKDVLAQRLESGYYSADLENRKEKLKELDRWIERTNGL